MADFKDQKEMKLAMNGRMCLMTGSILLLLTSLTSTLMYGISMFSAASGAAKGDEEYVKLLADTNMTIPVLYAVAVCFLAKAAIEVYSGVFCLLRSNRPDRSRASRRMVIFLLVTELVVQIFLALTGMMNLSSLFTSLIIPLYMLWGATRLCRLAKIYPDRTYALRTRKMQDTEPKKVSAPAPKKSLRDRAMMNSDVESSEEIHTDSEASEKDHVCAEASEQTTH